MVTEGDDAHHFWRGFPSRAGAAGVAACDAIGSSTSGILGRAAARARCGVFFGFR